jgi:hypothetical protein
MPHITSAVHLCKRIAASDDAAANELATVCRAEPEMEGKKSMPRRKTLLDPVFNLQVKHAFLSALITAGLVIGPFDEDWEKLSAEDAAQLLQTSHLASKPEFASDDPHIAGALKFCKQVAAGDSESARQMIAYTQSKLPKLEPKQAGIFQVTMLEEILAPNQLIDEAPHKERRVTAVGMGGRGWTSGWFGKQVKQALLKALLQLGILKNTRRKENATAQDLALLLAGTPHADPATIISDPALLMLTMSACRLAKRIAEGDAEAAKQLVADANAGDSWKQTNGHDRQVSGWKHRVESNATADVQIAAS